MGITKTPFFVQLNNTAELKPHGLGAVQIIVRPGI